jgi:dTDP-4-dehydrorhamnose reductase
MKLLVTGARGQVGHELLHALAPLGEVQAATRDGKLDDPTPCLALDLADLDAIASVLNAAAPNVIVNAAAWTAVDRAEDEPEQARRINAEAVAALATWAAKHGVPIVHYSTDYVFPGHGDRPLRETDITGPVSVYGSSKLSGEQALAASGADYLIFRTAWVYAARGHNFLRTMLRLGAERERLTVVDDQHGTPTSARLIADVTAQILRLWLDSDTTTRRAQSGIYHLVAGGQTTWCGFARAIMQKAVARGLLEHAPEVAAVGSGAFPTKATRPAWSVLDTRHLRETFGINPPDWQDGLEVVLDELAPTRPA